MEFVFTQKIVMIIELLKKVAFEFQGSMMGEDVNFYGVLTNVVELDYCFGY